MATTPIQPTYPEYGTFMREHGQRVDFKVDKFDLAIETKGYLLAWMRAAVCPCKPVSTHTEQPDPLCTLCKGQGWYYFGGNTPTDPTAVGRLNEVQSRIITDTNAMAIRGLITSIQNEYNPWDKLGNWQAGSMQLTVRKLNMLGYYDKVINLDSEIVYSEIMECDGGAALHKRYLVNGVNVLRSQAAVYRPEIDYYLEKGDVIFYPGKVPAVGTRVGIHYLCYPTWLIVEHPHAIRATLKRFKTKTPTTAGGDMYQLPIQALIRLDFLPG